MSTLTVGKREPLSAPLAGFSRNATLDGRTFRVTFTKHTAEAASASWRKPQTWTMGTVLELPEGVQRFHGRIHAGIGPIEVLLRAGLAFVCHSCLEHRGAWNRDKAMDGMCRECASRVQMAAPLELVEAR